MAEPVEFEGATHHYGPSRGNEDRMGWLHVLKNGTQTVCAWKFSREELQQMLDSGEPAFFSVWCGDGRVESQPVFPVMVGLKPAMNQMLLDFGKEVIK